jgi:hypothetical protein
MRNIHVPYALLGFMPSENVNLLSCSHCFNSECINTIKAYIDFLKLFFQQHAAVTCLPLVDPNIEPAVCCEE